MSLYVLDTDTLSLYQRGHPAVEQRVRAVPPGDLAISIISVEEQLTGWQTALRRARQPDDVARVYERFTATVRFLSGLNILPFTADAVRRYKDLTAQKLNIGKMDLRIAAIALQAGAIVVTRNVRDFRRVPNLVIEDWTL